eukprot:jgi/Mesen1/3218/ME001865S02419
MVKILKPPPVPALADSAPLDALSTLSPGVHDGVLAMTRATRATKATGAMKSIKDLLIKELQLAAAAGAPEDPSPSWTSYPGRGEAVLSSDGQQRYIELRTPERVVFRMSVSQEGLQFISITPTSQLWLVPKVQQGVSPVVAKDNIRTLCVTFLSEELSQDCESALQLWRRVTEDVPSGGGGGEKDKSVFDKKIEPASAKMYFHYYGQLLHQQNMLQDYVRTGTYYAAVLENKVDFEGRVVVDVGAGSGILSLFAAQAGAKHVYAVEASPMAEYARKLAAGNSTLGQRITVIHGKVEDVELPEKVDILISEPMGTLLVNERMLETYVIARERFLKPGGKMYPSLGRIHVAPFSDEYLYIEIANKALFWQQHSYYGVNLTPLHSDAFMGYFAQPVVDAFDPRLLVAPSSSHTLDFLSMTEEDLYEIEIPLNFRSTVAARRWLTTAPGQPTTHWYQLRCVLSQPLYVLAGQQITGILRLVAHSSQSYTIHLTMSAVAWGPSEQAGPVMQTASAKLDLKEPYYRMSQSSVYTWPQDQPPAQEQVSSRLALGRRRLWPAWQPSGGRAVGRVNINISATVLYMQHEP